MKNLASRDCYFVSGGANTDDCNNSLENTANDTITRVDVFYCDSLDKHDYTLDNIPKKIDDYVHSHLEND